MVSSDPLFDFRPFYRASWEFIKSAPKDGTCILLFVPAGGEWGFDKILTGPWDCSEHCWMSYPYLDRLSDQPTFWVHLPKPPEIYQ